jgi:hypothetical protein
MVLGGTIHATKTASIGQREGNRASVELLPKEKKKRYEPTDHCRDASHLHSFIPPRGLQCHCSPASVLDQ